MIAGRATREGTERFAERSNAAPGHFRDAMGGLRLSSLGLGTYLGAEDAETDAGYEASVAVALTSGVNVFDAAINYRGQRSERAIGRALARAFDADPARRDEVFVSTKGGYLPHDAEDPRPPRRYVAETFIETGVAPRAEVVQGSHCMSPDYLADQIARSRENLGLETIDLYYLHNVETQLSAVDRAGFTQRLERAIGALEVAAERGQIAAWGVATWDGLRAPPEHPEHLSIAEIARLAEKVGGPAHHFRAVQLPVNLAMGQGVVYRSQQTPEGRVSALTAANTAGIAAFGSASILQGRLAADLPEQVAEAFPEAGTPARQALQFSRSAPGMTTALVGVSTPEHARENFGLSTTPPASADAVLGLFR